MNGMFEVITNNKPVDLITFHDLTEKEQTDLDYMMEDEQMDARVFRYRGNVYDICDFQSVPPSSPPEMRRWQGYASDSFFSGVVIRFVDEGERVVVGRYIS